MAEVIKKAPTSTVEAGTNDKRQLFHKDTINNLPKQQKRVLLFLLSQPRPCSVADIVRALGQSDPRGHIRDLRDRGYPIADVWCKSADGVRYKRYFIRKEVEDGK